MGGWPEQIADAAKTATREAISRGYSEIVYVPERVHAATLAAALEVEERFRDQANEDRTGKARRDAPATSKAAAIKVAPRSGTQRRTLLDRLAQLGTYGATRDELAESLGMTPNTVRPRLVELMEGGFAYVDPNQQRPSASGEPAEVLRATEKGRGITRDSSPDLVALQPDRPPPAPPVLDLGGRPSTSPYDPENA